MPEVYRKAYGPLNVTVAKGPTRTVLVLSDRSHVFELALEDADAQELGGALILASNRNGQDG